VDSQDEISVQVEILENIVSQIQFHASHLSADREFTSSPIPGSVRLGEDPGLESRPATPGGVHSATDTRGPAETSNSRARQWAVSSHKRNIPIERPFIYGNDRAAGGAAGVGGISNTSTYKARFATLGAISFFGASVSWGAVFSGTRGNMALLAWSAALFVVATVSAGGMGIVIEGSLINMERDKAARRIVRAFAIISAAMIFGGITLMSIAMIDLRPRDDSVAWAGRHWITAAGIFPIVTSVVLIMISVGVRIKYAKVAWRF